MTDADGDDDDDDYDNDDDDGDDYDDAHDDGDVRFYTGCLSLSHKVCQERSRKTGPLTIGAPRGEAGVGPLIPSSTKRTAPAEVLGELLPRTLKSTRRCSGFPGISAYLEDRMRSQCQGNLTHRLWDNEYPHAEGLSVPA